MTIRREDLVAAAALGLLQYRQIDPLLVFLLQRDVVARRTAMLEESRRTPQDKLNRLLSYLLVLVGIVTAGLFALLFHSRPLPSVTPATLAFLAGLYLLGAILVAALLRRGAHGQRMRMMGAMIVATVPLAMLAYQNAFA